MKPEETADKIAFQIRTENKYKRMKVRNLLKLFNYEKRTEECSRKITELLSDREILLNPSIMKLGEDWPLKLDDCVLLFDRTKEVLPHPKKPYIYDYLSDPWFDEIIFKRFRTEKEVENKFIIPLLSRLGYQEDDRYDGMVINVSHGSRDTVLVVDFVLFDSENEELEGQPLLVAEAKREDKFLKQVELEKAQKQVKSYAIWLSCHFGLVTDGKTIQVIDLFPSIKGMKVIFDCKLKELRSNFNNLYEVIGKENLVNYYEKLIKVGNEQTVN